MAGDDHPQCSDSEKPSSRAKAPAPTRNSPSPSKGRRSVTPPSRRRRIAANTPTTPMGTFTMNSQRQLTLVAM